MCISVRLASGVLAGSIALSVSTAWAADWQEPRVYGYVADYDDVPTVTYYEAPAVEVGPVYGYAPVVRERVYHYRTRRVYGYAPVVRAPRVYGYVAVAPAAPVYGYGPSYGYAPPARYRDNMPLGVYAPRGTEHLSPPRRYFEAIQRQNGD